MLASQTLVPEQLIDIVEGGASITVATVDSRGRPETVRCAGATVAPDRASVELFVPAQTGARTRMNLEAGSAVSATICRVFDYYTVQLKGRCKEVREARPAERDLTLAYRAAFTESLYHVGMSRGLVRRLAVWPAFVVEVAVQTIFEQTPGPNAGEQLAPEGGK